MLPFLLYNVFVSYRTESNKGIRYCCRCASAITRQNTSANLMIAVRRSSVNVITRPAAAWPATWWRGRDVGSFIEPHYCGKQCEEFTSIMHVRKWAM